MSIDDLIVDRVGRRMLFLLIPRAPGETMRRALLVDERLWKMLQSPEGDQDWERRVGELQADLERFVTQKTLDPKYLFLLYPAQDAVWEIRSAQFEPSIRVLGLFAGLDVFVATNFALRSDLGEWQSREWKRVKTTARRAWANLFHPYSPVVTLDVHKLVTGALDGKYFKA